MYVMSSTVQCMYIVLMIRGQCTNKYRVQYMHLTYTTVNVCTMNMVHEHIEYSTFTDDRVQV
jgi:hypothetical protein